MKIKIWHLLSLIAFSILLHPSCQDRLFDNPFDPEAGEIIFEVMSTILTPSYMPLSLAWDGSTIWNVDGYNETLYSLDRLSGAQVRALTSPLQATTGIAYDGQDLWICSESSVDVYKINLLNGEIQKRLNLQTGSFTAIEYGLASLWLADIQSNKILRVDPETAEVLSSFSNPGVMVDGLAFDGNYFWISDSSTLTIYQVTTEGTVLRTFLSPGQSPRGLTFDGHYLWNVDGDRKIYQLRFQN
jgi:hypothetical protein